MISKPITIPYDKHKVSYYELNNKDIQSKLMKLNKSDKDNILYCSCHGESSKKKVKMMTRSINNGAFYIVANYPGTNKHHKNCLKNVYEKEITNKGRVYSFKDNYLPINIITSGPSKQITVGPSVKYNNLYALGEYLLSKAHNDYCDTYSKNAVSSKVLSELYEYYHEYCNSAIKSPLKSIVIYNSEGEIYLNDVIFNPKWINCDHKMDKTSAAVKHFRILNKKIDKPRSITKEYLLLKYDDYEEIDSNQVKIKLYAQGKNLKSNSDKYIYAYMNKDKFLNTLELYSLNSEDFKVDYYFSGLAFVKNHSLIIDEFSLIATYPNYCIPIHDIADIEVLHEVMKIRDKILIYPLSRIDKPDKKMFSQYIPDYLLKNVDTKQIVILESFNKYSSLYYQKMCEKTEYYENLCSKSEYEFIGYFKNLDWKLPPIQTLKYKEFKTLTNVSSKVNAAVKKFNMNGYKSL